jgi:hypothetical protein
MQLWENPRMTEIVEQGQAPQEADDENRMVKIGDLISRLQATKDQFGDTCVYIRRGGLAWGAVALNRRDDDKKHGIFDLQAQHDRDMLQRVGQVDRLMTSRRLAEESNYRLRQAICDTIESLERNSTSAPVVACLKAALVSPADQVHAETLIANQA